MPKVAKSQFIEKCYLERSRHCINIVNTYQHSIRHRILLRLITEEEMQKQLRFTIRRQHLADGNCDSPYILNCFLTSDTSCHCSYTAALTSCILTTST